MSTKQDIEISNLSYTNKDFGSMYPEVLKMAKSLSNSWDPEHSNESDPGVVLLKEAAFVADHNNYNIDKNILENFLPSATQDKSVRNITEMNGYTPKYYQSAVGDVTFSWTASDSEENLVSFIVPAFTFVISDSDNTVSYTQIEDLVISLDSESKYATSKCKFIEGTLQTVTINNSSIITLENLDDNNRIYLPETMVAQNGIYIRYSDETAHKEYGYWERNNYLLTQPTDSRVFKIDYDSSKELPYIEFPTDISSIIGDGIIINYIATSGSSGNVSANTLVNITTPTEFTDRSGYTRQSSDFSLNNAGSILNGKDPETISEMYRSFKKVVGTFDTLVTCNDYSNYLNYDEDISSLISNCIVTDRRTDYSKSLNVITYDNNGPYFENISIKPCTLNFTGVYDTKPTTADKGDIIVVGNKMYVNISTTSAVDWLETSSINLNDFSLLTEAMTPYDLTIHALAPFIETDMSESVPYKALENSFKPVTSSTLSSIEDVLMDESKCICHTFNDPETNEVYCFKNYTPLSISIIPYNKVTPDEQSDIIYSVYKAISTEFNPKNLNWGDSLDTSILKNVIINSDERIRDATIQPLKYETKVLTNQTDGSVYGKEYGIKEILTSTEETTVFIDLIAKNILAGRVCLFEFDSNFEYDYGQDKYLIKTGDSTYENKTGIYDGITKISTEVPIEIIKSSVKNIKYKKEQVTNLEVQSSNSNVKYLLNAPNYTETSGYKNITKGSWYTLQTTDVGTDKFIIQVTENDVVNTYTYISSSEIEYSIKFDSSDLTNKSGSTFETLPDGSLCIDCNEIILTSTDGTENLDYTLKQNEAVQILYPNYYSTNTYGIYVSYSYINTSSKTDKIIRANIDYTLENGEQIILKYTTDGANKEDYINPGQTVRTSFDLSPTSTGTKKSWVDANGNVHTSEFNQLSSDQTISTRSMMSTELSSTNLHCYWIINSNEDGVNRLFNTGVNERILNSDEYFMYSNANLDEMIILGSGSKITRDDGFGDEEGIWTIDSNDLTIESISENGITSSIPWQIINTSSHPVVTTEMNIVTLGEDDNIVINGWTDMTQKVGTQYYINNTWQPCNGSITYTSGGEITILPAVNNYYKIRSRLDLAMSSTTPQQLLITKNQETGEATAIQKVTITYSSGKQSFYCGKLEDDWDKNYMLQSSVSLNLLGRDSVNLTYYTSNDIDISMYAYVQGDSSSIAVNIDYDKTLDEFNDENPPGTYNYKATYPFNFYVPSGSNRQYLIPIYISGNEVDLVAKMYYKKSDGTVENINFLDYNKTESSSNLTLKGNCMYFLTPDTSLTNERIYLELTWSIVGIPSNDETSYKSPLSESEYFIIDELKVNLGLNSLISTDTDLVTLPLVLEKINSIISQSDKKTIKPYYIYEPENSMKINLTKYCVKNSSGTGYSSKAFDNPNIMWDINNVANSITIPQIDLANSTIGIEDNMKKDQ